MVSRSVSSVALGSVMLLLACPAHAGQCRGDSIDAIGNGTLRLSSGGSYKVPRWNTRRWRAGDEVIICAETMTDKKFPRAPVSWK